MNLESNVEHIKGDTVGYTLEDVVIFLMTINQYQEKKFVVQSKDEDSENDSFGYEQESTEKDKHEVIKKIKSTHVGKIKANDAHWFSKDGDPSGHIGHISDHIDTPENFSDANSDMPLSLELLKAKKKGKSIETKIQCEVNMKAKDSQVGILHRNKQNFVAGSPKKTRFPKAKNKQVIKALSTIEERMKSKISKDKEKSLSTIPQTPPLKSRSGRTIKKNCWTKSMQAGAIAALARMSVEDSRKLLPDKFYPSWVVFSERQKLNWLNTHLDKLWPYINEAASDVIRSYAEPILEQYRSAILVSLKFSKLTLGTVAPQFTGVSIIDGESDEVIMELELQWDGNPKIVLDIKTGLGIALPIQVKNIGFTGVFRIIFKPLVDEFPCFGALCCSLREKKKLDFNLKVVGGDISSIPGISDALEETIRDAVEDSITWPVRKIISILPGDYSYLELKQVGTLEVKLIEAKGLTNKDIIGKSDPYAELFIRPLRDRIKTSKTIDNQTNPIWNEHFEFVVEDVSTQNLTIRVYDNEGVQASELIGCARVPLRELEAGKVKDVWLKLVKDLEVQRDQKNRGQVHLEIMYYPLNASSELYNPFDPDTGLTTMEKVFKHANDAVKATSHMKKDVIIRGVLSVTVISAENLPATDLIGKSDPFVTLTLKKSQQKEKTRVLKETLNPIWNQAFEFVVEDGLHELLILEVYDHDLFGKEKIGRCIMTLSRAILEGEFRESFPLDGTESGRLNLHVKWKPQPILRD